MNHIAYPFQFDGGGVTARSDANRYARDLIEQLLITAPGERVMRPDFGGGLHQLVFAPNSETLAVAVDLSIQGAINQWLGDVVQASKVTVERVEEALHVTVQYTVRATRESVTATFTRAAP